MVPEATYGWNSAVDALQGADRAGAQDWANPRPARGHHIRVPGAVDLQMT